MLSIIIVNYNTYQITKNCIDSINKFTKIPYEIILIDNHSSEKETELFSQVSPSIIYKRLDDNVGFGRANNEGMKLAKGEIFLLLNSDTVLTEPSLDICWEHMMSEDLDVMGCTLTYEDGEIQQVVFPYEKEDTLLGGIVYNIKNISFLKYLHDKLKHKKTKISEMHQVALTPTDPNEGVAIGGITGACIFIKKSVAEATKGFDPDFFMYYEETDWFINRLLKYKIGYFSGTKIIHLMGRSSGGTSAMDIQFYMSQMLYWYKISYVHFAAHIFCKAIDTLSLPLLFLTERKNMAKNKFSNHLSSWKYIFDIIKYKNSFGSRDKYFKIHL